MCYIDTGSISEVLEIFVSFLLDIPTRAMWIQGLHAKLWKFVTFVLDIPIVGLY